MKKKQAEIIPFQSSKKVVFTNQEEINRKKRTNREKKIQNLKDKYFK
jgi:hypothetical protein